jgi:hypothetical protein
MTRLAISFFAVALVISEPASAQTSEPDTNSASIITTAPSPSASREVWYKKDMEDANARVLKLRNALIGTSVGFAVGAVIAGIGVSQCQTINVPGQDYDDVLCNRAGNVMVPLGGTIVALGAIGMLTTGIMLGVAKKRRREIERDFRRSAYGRRLRWDASGLRF